MIKVWMRSMQSDGCSYGDWQTELEFTTVIDKHDHVARSGAYNLLKLGRPLFLASEDELAKPEEITRLEELVEILTYERDRAQKKAQTLKAVVTDLLERL